VINWFAVPYALIRAVRRIRRILKRVDLRCRGVVVDDTAEIDPAAILEPSGGIIVVGARTFIDRGVILRPLGGRIVIGDDCAINAYSLLYGGGGLVIGNGVQIASHTVIVPSNHQFSDLKIPIKDQSLRLQGIEIADNVWIGSGARILDGVKIASGTVVGAGAVVTKSTEPDSVMIGVPASRRRFR
jgi:acetyltransferase-like isoleucine patch superfamily enzyme